MDDASQGIFWGWQCTPDIINKFKTQGIEVWGWRYIFDRRSSTSTTGVVNAIRRAIGCGIQGFVFDVEQEVKNPGTHAKLREILMQAKQVIPNGCMGYTSFGAPDFHPEVPWRLLNERCDLQLPQIYFEKFTFGSGTEGSEQENENEVTSCLEQHRRWGLDKPILPLWGSESDSQYPASKNELQKYLTKYPGSSIWRAPNAGERGEAWKCNYNLFADIQTGDHPDPQLLRSYQPAPIPLPFHRILKLGDKGEDVYHLICALMGLKYLRLNQKEVTEVFNINVDGAVRRAQHQMHVEVDGEVGPDTKSALENALHRARPEPENKTSSPGGFKGLEFAKFCEAELSQNIPWSQSIKFIQPFVREFGHSPWHWCGATVYWLINEFLYKPNGKTMQLSYPGMEATFALVEACQQYFQHQDWYKDNRDGYVPPPGAIVIFDWDQVNIDQPDHDYDNHIGVFLRMNGDLFVCAEGNTDRGNNFPNGRTRIRERPRYLIQGFGILPEGFLPT